MKVGFVYKFAVKVPFLFVTCLCNKFLSMAYFLVEKRRHANMSQKKLNHLLNMAGRILLLHVALVMMALVNKEMEVFPTKIPALCYIIKKFFIVR